MDRIRQGLVHVRAVNGFLAVHRFHPETGQNANEYDPDFTANDRELFAHLREQGAEFVWIDCEGIQVRVIMTQLIDIAIEHGLHGVSVCEHNHATERTGSLH